MRRISIFTGIIVFCLATTAKTQQSLPEFIQYRDSPWVDSVMTTLSPDERIAQLIFVAAYSNRGPEHQRELLKMIREQKIGGLITFQGGAGRQAALMNRYQSASDVPLLIAMDAEWGLGMRLDSTISFPFQMTLGAIQDNDLIFQMGRSLGQQMKRLGVHVNLAPVVDVNNNADNPVINYRSFGENKLKVAQKGIAYMKGLQQEHILTTAKHFPGHGDTDTDSHFALPQINHPRTRLDSIELYPFRQLIREGVGGVMVAHLNIPALDSTGLPSTLSQSIITQLLKEELGFQGLVVTDAMNMQGVKGNRSPGVVDKDAVLAGNDMLELTEDVPRAIEEIRNAIRAGTITQKQIDDKCRKILAVKHWVGLDQYEPTPLMGLAPDLNSVTARLLNKKLMEAAITVLKNEQDLLPIKDLDSLSVASVSFGPTSQTTFQTSLSLYTDVKHFHLAEKAGVAEVRILRSELEKYQLVIGGIHDNGIRPLNRINYSPAVIDFIAELSRRENTVMAVFKNPYVLDKLKDLESADGLIVTYEDNFNAESLAAQLIFGGISASGRLPVSVSAFSEGDGLDITGGIRFGYTFPEEVGMDSEILFRRVDSLVNQALDAKAIPGCQVLVARDKKVVLHKAYGLHTYSDTVQVKLTDVYDLASLTKISTSLAALMKLYDDGKFKLDATLGDYLPKFRRSNKTDISMRDLLAHQGRLIPYISFYQKTFRKNGSFKWATVKKDSSKRFPIKLTDNMFLHRKYSDKIIKGIRKSPLRAEKKYVYSDFFFILAPRIVERMITTDFSSYLQKEFYNPLGATTITYNPFEIYPANTIVPTENDYLFRRQPVHGSVHDENAAMLEGISGHAGLFANANDLAKLMQMYLDMGVYGDKRYIRAETLREFSRTQFPENDNRRGLGFDKPNLEYRGLNNNTAEGAGPASFGHTGFTGTFAWMDPDTGLLYIFLSNRVTPTRENTRLYQLNTRIQVQQVMYDALQQENVRPESGKQFTPEP